MKIILQLSNYNYENKLKLFKLLITSDILYKIKLLFTFQFFFFFNPYSSFKQHKKKY